MSEHTPGPWDCHQAFETLEQNRDNREWKPARVYAGQHPICDIKVIKIGERYEKNHSPQEANANAILIAAAPDLRAACDKAAVYFNACGKAWAANDGILIAEGGRPIVAAEGLDQLCDTACESVFAAIAKAKGGGA